jgi:uncharacterized protein YeaO (DUF488 family)
MIRIKRVYDPPASSDGERILVDRLWPRGMTKEKARIDDWLKDLAPSDGLRKWYGHDPEKWVQFKRKYFQELKGQEAGINLLRKRIREGTVTFLYQAKNEKINNAVALKEYLEKVEKGPKKRARIK